MTNESVFQGREESLFIYIAHSFTSFSFFFSPPWTAGVLGAGLLYQKSTIFRTILCSALHTTFCMPDAAEPDPQSLSSLAALVAR
jgi:hypothetical protein